MVTVFQIYALLWFNDSLYSILRFNNDSILCRLVWVWIFTMHLKMLNIIVVFYCFLLRCLGCLVTFQSYVFWVNIRLRVSFTLFIGFFCDFFQKSPGLPCYILGSFMMQKFFWDFLLGVLRLVCSAFIGGFVNFMMAN